MKSEQEIQDSIGWVEDDDDVCYRCIDHIDNCECGLNDYWIQKSELNQYVNDPEYNQGPAPE